MIFNYIAPFPEWIGELTNLKYLSLGAYQSVTMTNSIKLLKNLNSLHLWKKQKIEIPISKTSPSSNSRTYLVKYKKQPRSVKKLLKYLRKRGYDIREY
jgi:Leucine-rich repeat (LRR) protein